MGCKITNPVKTNSGNLYCSEMAINGFMDGTLYLKFTRIDGKKTFVWVGPDEVETLRNYLNEKKNS